MSNFAKGQLKSLVERVERLEEEKKVLAGDIREVMGEAKGHGFNTKIIRKILQLRAMPPADRAEQEELVALYESALTDDSVVQMRTVSTAPVAQAAE